MGYNNVKPHQMSALSAKKRKLATLRNFNTINDVGDIFGKIFFPLGPYVHCLKPKAYLSAVADHVRLFMNAVIPPSAG